MTVEEYNEVWYPKISNSLTLLHALEHNIKKAESPEEALLNLQLLGWSSELQKFMEDAISMYRRSLLDQIESR